MVLDVDVEKERISLGIKQLQEDPFRQAIAGLKKGVLVYVPRFKQRCLVHKVDRERGEAVVQLGGMKMRVSLEEVTPYESL